MSDDLKNKLKAWEIDEPPHDLVRRIADHALSHPQREPFHRRLSRMLEVAFFDLGSGLSYKLASMALIALVGLITGLSWPQTTAVEPGLIDLATGFTDIETMEGS